MSIEAYQGRIEQLQAQLAEIAEQKAESNDAVTYAQEQLAEARAELDSLNAEVRTQAAGGTTTVNAHELLEAMTTAARLEATVAEVEREAAPKLEALNREEERLRGELGAATRELNRARFHDAVIRYEAAIKPAMPIADEIRGLARKAGIALAPDDVPSCLLHRYPEYLNIAGYVLKV